MLSSIRRLRDVVFQRLWERAVLTAILLAGVVAISPNVADPDLWGHVRYGRDLLQNGLPTTTTYSYIAGEQPWINHENLMEMLLALGAEWLGPLGLVAAKMLAGFALLLTIALQCRRQGAGLLATSLVLLLTANGLAHYWSLRPQLFSFAAYTAMLALLAWCFEGWEGSWQLRIGSGGQEPMAPDRCPRSPVPCSISYRSGRMRWMWLMPPLMAAWTNAHGGFLAGGVIFTVYLLLRGWEAYSQRGVEAIGLLRRFALMITATLTATFINPYAHQFHLWLVDDLRVPRPEILEWLPPSFLDTQSIPLILLIATFVAVLLFSKRSFDVTHLVILLATLWQSLEHQRHIPFFALSCAFFLPRHVEAVLARLRSEPKDAPAGPLHWLATAALLAAFVLLGWKLYDRASDLKVHRGYYPVGAVQFMADHSLRGRLLCTFNWAQYALAALNPDPREPQVLVHVDGRCRTAYSQAMLDAHFDFLFGDQPASLRFREPGSRFEPLRALASGDPHLVLLDRGQPYSIGVMQSQSQRWVLLYQDDTAQLWGRRERYDDPRSKDYLPPQRRRVSDEPQVGTVTWPALPGACAQGTQ